MTKQLAALVQATAALTMTVVLLSVFGRWHFVLDLASHFRIQATVALVVSSPILYLLKSRRWAIATGVVGAVLALSLWPFLRPSFAITPSQYRLLLMNVLTQNSRQDLVVDFILKDDPDFIVLQETSSQWIDALDPVLGTSWPYRKCEPRSDNFGIALYSKVPWKSCEVVRYSGNSSIPSIDARFRLPDGSDLRLIATHPLPPMTHETWSIRNEVFASLARGIPKTEGKRTMVVGDLNCTPWSYWFRRLKRDSRLRNSAEGHGLNITWMPIPIAVCGLPIDHVLVGSAIQVSRRSVGSYVGSDHRPVVVDFE